VWTATSRHVYDRRPGGSQAAAAAAAGLETVLGVRNPLTDADEGLHVTGPAPRPASPGGSLPSSRPDRVKRGARADPFRFGTVSSMFQCPAVHLVSADWRPAQRPVPTGFDQPPSHFLVPARQQDEEIWARLREGFGGSGRSSQRSARAKTDARRRFYRRCSTCVSPAGDDRGYQTLMAYYTSAGRRRFRCRLRAALERLLVSPDFLFRI